ncbi:hypothetical protein CMUS01_09532 [Colletotrichum musicola]|uniref:Uncharacterized protein n=1 Tax=Colletotrichum musicola TaxID=2175873 RepID=A0A8H6K8M9_9PEZI|nr:hypothetical protein CMUS01_09532 [Colletotrichum musicola]
MPEQEMVGVQQKVKAFDSEVKAEETISQLDDPWKVSTCRSGRTPGKVRHVRPAVNQAEHEAAAKETDRVASASTVDEGRQWGAGDGHWSVIGKDRDER